MGLARYLVTSLLAIGCGRISFDPLAPIGDEIVIEPAFPTTGARWNDYVLPDGSVCPHTGQGAEQFHDACLHGAELLIARLPGETSCADLEISDEIDALQWKCREDQGVTLYTRGLRPDATLASLLEPDAWKPNRLTVRRKGTLLYTSAPAAWWTNPVVPLPDNSDTNVATLDQPSTIYTLAQSDWTTGYFVTAPGIAVVTLDDSVLSFSGTANNCDTPPAPGLDSTCIIATDLAVERLWFEGTFSGGAPARADVAMFLNEATFPVVRHVRAFQFTSDAVQLYLTEGALVDELVSMNNDGAGLTDVYSGYAIERDIVVANNNSMGMLVTDGGPWRLTNIVAVNNAADGIQFDFNALGVLANVIVAHNGFNGLRWTQVDLQQAVTNRVLSVNNNSDGIIIGSMYDNSLTHTVSLNNALGINTTNMGSGNRFAQLVNAHNGVYGLRSANFSSSTYSGQLLFGNNFTADCIETGIATNPGIDSACNSAASLSLGNDLGATFVGPTTRTTTGQLVKDWFEPPFTIWARDGSPLVAGIRGPCGATETCRAWDFSLAATDTVLRGRASVEPFVPGAACPAAVHGDRVMRDPTGNCPDPNWAGSCNRTFLIDAVERDDDYVGNDDGLCESNEDCIYAPNFGLDHGSGSLVGPCMFANGLVTDVTMFAHGP
jgi:hypothetical protein